MAARKKAATAEVIPLNPPPAVPQGVAYSSIRLKEQGHKLRFSHGPKLVQATDDQTITRVTENGYTFYIVHPGGVEFPADNVASAIRKGAAIDAKLSRTGRMNARKERIMKMASEKRAVQAKTEVQFVDAEDNDPLPLEGDEDE